MEWIIETSELTKVGKKEIRVIALEGLIVAKHRAGRTQDVADQTEDAHASNILWCAYLRLEPAI